MNTEITAKFYKEFLTRGWVQTFDDTKQNTAGFVLSFPGKEMLIHRKEIREKNRKGMGVYFTPNPCEGGRKEENVTSVQWVFADLDDYSEQDMKAVVKRAPVRPSIVVRTGRGFHLYWKCGCSRDQFTKLVEGIIFFFDSDPAISSINEVLRLPGYYHMKDPDNPKMVEIIHFNPELVTIDEMLKAYPSPVKQVQRQYNDDAELEFLKDVPITRVLERLGVEVKQRAIWENGEKTSAMVNEKGNYINRFSGKPGSGSTIDAVMEYGKMELNEAIDWLRDMAGVKKDPKKVAKVVLKREEVEQDRIDTDRKDMTWGTPNLDQRITPIESHHFVLLVGETGSGKTTFCFDVAYKNSLKGIKVLFISLEMTEDEIATRFARTHAGITKAEWRNRKAIPKEKVEAYRRKKKELLGNDSLLLRGFPKDVPPTTENVFAVVEEAKPDMVVLDNFDLVWKDDRKSEYQEQTRIAKEIMDFTNNRKIPMIVLHHFNKGSDKDKIRGLDSIRGSSKIIHNADTGLICYRKFEEDASPEDNAMFTIVQKKDRDFGQGAVCVVYFQYGVFGDEYNDGNEVADYKNPDWWSKDS